MPINYPVLFPEMAIALVRRASARLPRNHFIFRTDPKWTKQEIKEYLQKVYEMDVERVATINYLGEYPLALLRSTCPASALASSCAPSAQARCAGAVAFGPTCA